MGFMHTLQVKAKEDVRCKVKGLEYHAITCDNWTSVANDGYTAVTAHGINVDWEIKDYIIAVQNIKVAFKICVFKLVLMIFKMLIHA